jgi:MFS family permease
MPSEPGACPIAVSRVALREGLFYGWYVAAACAAIAFVAWGVAFYNLGVFLDALHEQRGWSRSSLSGGVTVFYVVTGLTGLAAGRVVDRLGPRPLLAGGGLAIGAAVLGLGQARALWQVYALDGLLAAGYGCTHSLVIGAVVSRWFRRRRALAMTIALSGASVGGLTLVPLSTALMEWSGLTLASAVLAAIALGLVLPAALLVVRDRPENTGPDGDPSPAPEAAPVPEVRWAVRDALATRAWWLITLAFTIMLVGQIAYLVHQVSYIRPQLGAAAAAAAVVCTNIGALAGRVVLGALGDRVAKHTLAAGCFLFQAAAVLLSAHTGNALLLFVAAAAIGLTIANVIGLQPLIMAEQFGVGSYGAVYGPAYLLTQLGAAGGPLLVGVLADSTGGYTMPFTLTASLAVLSAALILGARERAAERRR